MASLTRRIVAVGWPVPLAALVSDTRRYPSVLDFIVQQAYKNSVVDVVKATFDVAFNKPTRTVELPSQLF